MKFELESPGASAASFPLTYSSHCLFPAHPTAVHVSITISLPTIRPVRCLACLVHQMDSTLPLAILIWTLIGRAQVFCLSVLSLLFSVEWGMFFLNFIFVGTL